MAEIDLAFCCDCTGSMAQYIRAAQANIVAIYEEIHTTVQGASLRLALIKYRDHPRPGGALPSNGYVVELYDFTSSIAVMKRAVDTMAAGGGGGDGPEAVSIALTEAVNLAWRPSASKLCIVIGDAPPHGLGESHDNYPDGCPQGTDPMKAVADMQNLGIVIFSIGVEPTLSTHFKHARDFFMMLAAATEGRFLPLGNAALLPRLIAACATEESSIAQLWNEIEREVLAEVQSSNDIVTPEAFVERVEAQMARSNRHVVQVRLDNPYLDFRYNGANLLHLMRAPTLTAARDTLDEGLNAHVLDALSGFAWAAQEMQVERSRIAPEQTRRIADRMRKVRRIPQAL